MPTAIIITSAEVNGTTPALAVPPTTVVPLGIVTPVVGPPTLTAGQPDADWANSEVDHYGTWGSAHLIVGGKDVQFFRGQSATVSNYQLTEPYGYGPADVVVPGVSSLEVDAWGTGDLKWMKNGAKAQLVQVDDTGTRVRTMWRGIVTSPNPTLAGLLLHCDGEASGKLELRDKHPALFILRSHIGRKIYDAFNSCRLSLTPYLGGNIGVKTDGRGRSGTYLDFVNGLLADTITETGGQYTIAPKQAGGYELVHKDRTTVDFTIFNGAHGVDCSGLASDISEQPTSIFGQWVTPEGMVGSNNKYPGLIQGTAPDYPMTDNSSFGEGTTDADTDTGDGVTIMISKLIGMGYLNREDAPGGYDDDVTAALQDLQADAGLTQSGNMNTATWSALYDLSVTGYSILQAFQAPIAQASAVRVWNRTSNGSNASRNPDYDPSRLDIDLSPDHGPNADTSAVRAWSRAKLALAQTGKNWAGVITLTSDVAAGSAVYTDSITPMSRLDIAAGMNVMVRNFDGDTLMHVAVVNVGADLSVQLGVDTQARDAADLGEVIARRIESRQSPARQWRRAHRGTDANVMRVQWAPEFGRVFNKVSIPEATWTQIKVLGGQAGTLNQVQIQTTSDEAAFCTVIATDPGIGPAWLNHHIGDPLGSGADNWQNQGAIQTAINNGRIVGVWGNGTQPCGYEPGQKTDASGTATGDEITGFFRDRAGLPYWTNPLLYVMIYADRDCVIQPQRILDAVPEAY